MLPHEKALVKRMKERPFALIGINSDGDAATVKQIVADNQITWRQAVEGSQQGPLATRWNLREWPLIYVIDKQGVIRFKNIRARKIEESVRPLLNEADVKK